MDNDFRDVGSEEDAFFILSLFHGLVGDAIIVEMSLRRIYFKSSVDLKLLTISI